MRIKHFLTYLTVLILGLALTGCAGLSTKNTADITCSRVTPCKGLLGWWCTVELVVTKELMMAVELLNEKACIAREFVLETLRFDPPGEARQDWELVQELARRLDCMPQRLRVFGITGHDFGYGPMSRSLHRAVEPLVDWVRALGDVHLLTWGLDASHDEVDSTGEGVVRIHRIPYDVSAASRKIVSAGLPEPLAIRLELGK